MAAARMVAPRTRVSMPLAKAPHASFPSVNGLGSFSARAFSAPAWTEHPDQFHMRHNGIVPTDEAEMCKVVGVKDIHQLMDETVPQSIRNRPPLKIGKALTETEALAKLEKMVSTNQIHKSYIGMGYYNTITPPPILRNIIQNPGWYTPYTPYQAEISQGRMESLVNYQTMISDLTGMEIAQASLLDEATAAAEAMAMCQTITKGKKTKFFISDLCNPQTIAVCQTRAEPMDIQIEVGDASKVTLDNSWMGILIPQVATDGSIHDFSATIKQANGNKVNVCMVSDLMALTLLTPPGEIGADIVVGNTQRFGVPLGYGGPHAAFLTCKDAHKRAVPGRIIGLSRDAAGDPAYRLALQAREQHIRREKANSNICTAQALLANTAAFYAVYHGPTGLKKIAERINGFAKALAAGLNDAGIKTGTAAYFDTVRIEGVDAPALCKKAEAQGMNLRMLDAKTITISIDETTDPEDVDALLKIFGAKKSVGDLFGSVTPGFEGALKRSSKYLEAEVFNKYHTETELMRYMFHLQSKDLGLNTSMIPLGSCTMKLNSASEMVPVTWPAINNIHPFVPLSQVTGYQAMIQELGEWLIDITGFDAISQQPNAGASGEYAGLMAIREYHKANGQTGRNICLIPRAAHGTNPATAAMCGMEVVPIECDDEGNTDMNDLRDKIATHKDKLGALMITYPSTHGVFEDTIVDICKQVHDAGGLVYMDGANMNAQVEPEPGSDVPTP
jgi:glycine dehydrogenase